MPNYPRYQLANSTGWTFALDDTNGIYLQDIDADSSPSLALDSQEVARKAGGKLVSATTQPKKIPLKGVVIGTSWSDLDTKLDAFKAAIYGTNLWLDIDNGTQCKRYIVSTDGSMTAKRTGQTVSADFAVTMRAIDFPYALDATFGSSLVSTSAVNDSNVTVDIYTTSATFLGSAPPAVKATITLSTPGDLTSIDFVDVTNSKALTITPSGTISTGDVIVIDTSIPKVTLNNQVVPFTGSFPDFQPGTVQNIAIYAYTSSGYILDQSQKLGNSSQIIWKSTQVIGNSWTTGSTAAPLSRIQFQARKVGSPTAPITLVVKADNGSGTAPSGAALATITIPYTALSNIYTQITAAIPLPNLTNATKYWFLLSSTAGGGETLDLADYYEVRTMVTSPKAYANGGAFYSSDSGSSYTALTNTNLVFKTYRSVNALKNDTLDTGAYSEPFTATTYKDGAHTASTWDTTNHRLIQAGATTNDPYTYSTDTSTNNCFGSTTNQYMGFRFTTNNNGYNEILDSVVLKLYNDASPPSGNIQVGIYNDLTGGGTSVGSLIANTTTTTNLNTLTTTPTNYTFNFSGVTLAPNTSYVIMASCPAATSGSRLRWHSDWSTFSGSYTSQNLYVVASTLAILTYYASGRAVATVNAHYIDYSAAEENRSINVAATTNADILAAVPTFTGNGVGTQALTLSSDGGTNYEAATSGSQLMFVNNGQDLRWKEILTGTSTLASAINATASIAYYLGIALSSTNNRIVESFVQPSTNSLARVDLFLGYKGAPGTLTVRIETDSAGSPSGSLVAAGASGTLTTSGLTAESLGWASINLSTPPALTNGTTYWIVVTVGATANTANKWVVVANNARYASGVLKKSTNGGTSYSTLASGEDMMFKLFSASGANFAYNHQLTYTKRWL